MKTRLFFITLIMTVTFGATSASFKSLPQSISVYSGTCTYYKKTMINATQYKTEAISRAYGKVVLNRSTKRFTFIYGGKTIVTGDNYHNTIDDTEGGEGFSMLPPPYSAHRFRAEHVFKIYEDSSGGKNAGYEYNIVDYKED